MRIAILLSIFLLLVTEAFSQAIRGGEIFAKAEWSTETLVFIRIYREGNIGKPFLLFDWGDGTIDTLTGHTVFTLPPGIIVDEYKGWHYYDATGTYILSARDSFLVENIVNIPNSGEKELHLRDTFVLPDPPLIFNNLPFYGTSQMSVSIDNLGAYLHSPAVHRRDLIDSTSFSLVPYPAEGYTFPEATDSLVCCIYWNRPTMPGKYALAMRAYDWRFGELVGTATRAMIFDVDSLPVASGEVFSPFETINLYPNPAFSLLHIDWQPWTAISISENLRLNVSDWMGRIIHSEKISFNGSRFRHSLEVFDWPPGLYLLELHVGDRRLVRKFVVQ